MKTGSTDLTNGTVAVKTWSSTYVLLSENQNENRNRKDETAPKLVAYVSFTFLLAFRLPVTPIMFLTKTRECKRVPKVGLTLGLAGRSNIGIFMLLTPAESRSDFYYGTSSSLI